MLLRYIDAAVKRFASLFESSAPAASRAPWQMPLLLIIVAAAAVLRFWGLGNVGLHGDEDLMSLPARHVLEDGTPLLPSGMFYPRAILQVYLMAGSAMLFGPSEWALRLPSLLCGLALIPLSYFLGRRFLTPVWNMAFVALVAFLPALIADSQEARMYIFLLTCLAGYTALLFQWEKSGRVLHLLAAIVVMLIGIQFHELAIFGAFLVLFPGLVRGDTRKVLQGIAAFAAMLVGHELISRWIGGFYPDRPDGTDEVMNNYAIPAPMLEPTPGALELLPHLWQGLLVILAAAALAVFVARKADRRVAAVAGGALLFLGLLAQAGLYYHAAAFLLVAGAIVVQRNGRAALARLGVLAGVSAIAAIGHMILLHQAGVSPFRRVIGALVGQPSIWPLLQLGQYSRVAWAIAWIGFGWALWRCLSGRRMADQWLFFFMSVWLPLAGVGLFMWYVPERYTEFALLPLLIAALATVQYSMSRLQNPAARHSWVPVAAAVLACVLMINSLALARTLNPGYDIHPDHKGAAQFMRAVKLGPKDIVLAEDATMQTYYLGHVDYSLVARYVAAGYVQRVNDKILNIYTHAPMITTGEELLGLLRSPDRGALYVIGSGENHEDGRKHMRGLGIAEALAAPEWQTVYEGRDGLTKIWKAPPNAQSE